jgi:hypothetical protein
MQSIPTIKANCGFLFSFYNFLNWLSLHWQHHPYPDLQNQFSFSIRSHQNHALTLIRRFLGAKFTKTVTFTNNIFRFKTLCNSETMVRTSIPVSTFNQKFVGGIFSASRLFLYEYPFGKILKLNRFFLWFSFFCSRY